MVLWKAILLVTRNLGRLVTVGCEKHMQTGLATVSIGDIAAFDNWESCLSDVDTVIHLAACVHQMGEQSDQVALNYQCTNVDATMRLAQAAVKFYQKAGPLRLPPSERCS